METVSAIIESAEHLETLHESLGQVIANLNDEEYVPERWGSSPLAELAESDFHTLSDANRVIHRLYLGAKYKNGTVASYVEYHDESKEEEDAEG